MSVHGAGAVTCECCKDTIIGCKGGDLCPLLCDVKSNFEIISGVAKSGSQLLVDFVLPPRLRSVFSSFNRARAHWVPYM